MAISVLPAETPETPISPPSTLTAAMPASSEDAAIDPSPPHTKSSSPPKGSALRGNRRQARSQPQAGCADACGKANALHAVALPQRAQCTKRYYHAEYLANSFSLSHQAMQHLKNTKSQARPPTVQGVFPAIAWLRDLRKTDAWERGSPAAGWAILIRG